MNLDVTRSELEALFMEVGEVTEVFIPTDRDTGRPRGFAFVQFANSSSVSSAIQKFHDYELQGRPLRVSEAEERRPRRPDFSGGGGGGEGYSSANKPPWKSKAKGSRRNLRKNKRGF